MAELRLTSGEEVFLRNMVRKPGRARSNRQCPCGQVLTLTRLLSATMYLATGYIATQFSQKTILLLTRFAMTCRLGQHSVKMSALSFLPADAMTFCLAIGFPHLQLSITVTLPHRRVVLTDPGSSRARPSDSLRSYQFPTPRPYGARWKPLTIFRTTDIAFTTRFRSPRPDASSASPAYGYDRRFACAGP